MALTELAIKSFKPKAKLYRVADSSGLCLEIAPSGSKLWRWRYYFNGKAQMFALGKYPAISLSEVRKKRDAARELLNAGKHPGREKKIQKLRKAHEMDNTFEKIARRWLEVRGEGKSERYNTQSLARMERHVFPLIGGLPLVDITIPDVVEVVETIGKRGTIEIANRMKQAINQTFRYASQRGLCTHNPAADLRDILPCSEEKHHACVSPTELPKLLRAVESYNSDQARIAMQLLALTFVRTGELIGAQWDEIDWDRQEWHIPKERMKMKRPHVVPLSTQAIALLRELQTRTGQRSHVFYSAASKNKHISNGAVLMALRRMGYRGRMTGHGFRTMASTILNEKGYAPDVIERQLAHEDSDKIRAAYNRAEYLPERKKMMQEYADYLTAIKDKARENKIADMKGQRLKRIA
ncbi:tyrosine-type recombinase/integrase [Mucilaginibacter paludis]|uniref:Integrase family protein n=1 Tax=Mucilaginibacter paludis DSM 18603 TaxID=714943 RepID=H1Y3L2_9SPHI|nr:tyrosine-type recombinase/integrase [Mucilaginibacter paludis]EHQ29780.1 integrase family protein [Mucilaginibacter paludis DSM 18603]